MSNQVPSTGIPNQGIPNADSPLARLSGIVSPKGDPSAVIARLTTPWYQLLLSMFQSIGVQATAVVQPGTAIASYGAAVPGNYLLANGQAVSRSQYKTLFAALGTFYGPGDGVNTFNLPTIPLTGARLSYWCVKT